MSCILRVQETSKQHDRVETHVPRAWGRRRGGPCYGSGYLDVSIALARRKLGIRGEQPVCLQKAITEFPRSAIYRLTELISMTPPPATAVRSWTACRYPPWHTEQLFEANDGEEQNRCWQEMHLVAASLLRLNAGEHELRGQVS